jgi:hypothetical protein
MWITLFTRSNTWYPFVRSSYSYNKHLFFNTNLFYFSFGKCMYVTQQKIFKWLTFVFLSQFVFFSFGTCMYAIQRKIFKWLTFVFYPNLFYFSFGMCMYATQRKIFKWLTFWFFTWKNLLIHRSKICSIGIQVNQIENCINCLYTQVCRYLTFQRHISCPLHDCLIFLFKQSIWLGC